MPYDYDIKAKQFTGERRITRREVRAEIDKLLQEVEKTAARYGKSLQGADISLAEFEAGMRELLRSAHIVAASVGRGGRDLMTLSDWGKVGAKIAWQNRYLEKFARKIERGTLSEASIANRAKSYSSAIFVSFSDTYQKAQTEFVEDGKNPILARLVTNSQESCAECASDEAEGWMSVDDMKEIGTRICGDFCLCDIEFSDEELLQVKVQVNIDA